MLYYTAGTNGGANLFAYCLNNPVMYTDPEGYFVVAFLVSLGLSVGAAWAVTGVVVAVGLLLLEMQTHIISDTLEWMWDGMVDIIDLISGPRPIVKIETNIDKSMDFLRKLKETVTLAKSDTIVLPKSRTTALPLPKKRDRTIARERDWVTPTTKDIDDSRSEPGPRIYQFAYTYWDAPDLYKVGPYLNLFEALILLNMLGYVIDDFPYPEFAHFIDMNLVNQAYNSLSNEIFDKSAFICGIYTLDKTNAVKLGTAAGAYKFHSGHLDNLHMPQYAHYHIKTNEAVHIWFGSKLQ